MPDMLSRSILIAVLLFISSVSNGQTFAKLLANGNDWRLCGSIENHDTLVFMKAPQNTVAYSCGQDEYAQLLIDENLSFKMLLWIREFCFINPGVMELNEDTGEFRFYYDDGSSRDYLLIYLDKKKLVLVDRNY